MTAIVCDICKKAIAGARRGDTYITILDKDVCIPCSDELLDATKEQMAARRPYLFKDYQSTLAKNLGQMTR
jgi:uracil-DNA glycosylase